MTSGPTASPRRRRWGVLLAVAVVAAALAWLAFSGIGNALVYYKTPTELKALGEAGIGVSLRLGGLVEAGTLSCADGAVQFTLTDGQTSVPVRSAAGAPALLCPRERIGVVVEGKLSSAGVFEPSQVIIKHDENYVAPSSGAIPSQVIDPGS